MAFITEVFPDPDTTPTAADKLRALMGAKAPTTPTDAGLSPIVTKERYRPQNADRVALRPDASLLRQIKLHCLEQGITLTRWFELKALEQIAENDKAYGRQGAKAPQTIELNKKRDKELSSIARLFQFWTKAFNDHALHHRSPWTPVWTHRDATEADKLAHIPEQHIEEGILVVLSRREKGTARINSFRYYVAEIIEQDRIMQTMEARTKSIMLREHIRAMEKYLNVKRFAD